MVIQMFSVYDVKTKIFQSPFYAHNSGHAMRIMTDAVSKPDSQFGRYPEDFLLFEVGMFDDQSGLVLGSETPQQVIAVSELVKVGGE